MTILFLHEGKYRSLNEIAKFEKMCKKSLKDRYLKYGGDMKKALAIRRKVKNKLAIEDFDIDVTKSPKICRACVADVSCDRDALFRGFCSSHHSQFHKWGILEKFGLPKKIRNCSMQ